MDNYTVKYVEYHEFQRSDNTWYAKYTPIHEDGTAEEALCSIPHERYHELCDVPWHVVEHYKTGKVIDRGYWKRLS